MPHKPKVKDILLALGVGSLVIGSIVAPGLPKALSYVVKQKRGKDRLSKFDHGHFRRELKRLQKRGLVEIYERNNKLVARLTDKGKERFVKFDIDNMRVEKPKNWDGKWRVVIFDIPNTKKKARDLFRRRLKSLGFYSLQESVFVYPFPCTREVEILMSNYGLLHNEIISLLVEKIEGEKLSVNNFYSG